MYMSSIYCFHHFMHVCALLTSPLFTWNFFFYLIHKLEMLFMEMEKELEELKLERKAAAAVEETHKQQNTIEMVEESRDFDEDMDQVTEGVGRSSTTTIENNGMRAPEDIELTVVETKEERCMSGEEASDSQKKEVCSNTQKETVGICNLVKCRYTLEGIYSLRYRSRAQICSLFVIIIVVEACLYTLNFLVWIIMFPCPKTVCLLLQSGPVICEFILFGFKG